MNEKFWSAKDFDIEWLCWCGQPMLYDGALCVERDYDRNAMKVIAVSLDMQHSIICQKEY